MYGFVSELVFAFWIVFLLWLLQMWFLSIMFMVQLDFVFISEVLVAAYVSTWAFL